MSFDFERVFDSITESDIYSDMVNSFEANGSYQGQQGSQLKKGNDPCCSTDCPQENNTYNPNGGLDTDWDIEPRCTHFLELADDSYFDDPTHWRLHATVCFAEGCPVDFCFFNDRDHKHSICIGDFCLFSDHSGHGSCFPDWTRNCDGDGGACPFDCWNDPHNHNCTLDCVFDNGGCWSDCWSDKNNHNCTFDGLCLTDWCPIDW